ncbi:DEAD/DEAH box helicase [Ideonella livida]|uniref:DEAD/DEAH box helicase n=1 Tax=Ideonella livida TaxID=2707176 RepID=A0A7C9PGS7_9BURK|nr:DEAD/DEAH box helicase [Ideonella livida]NDY91513.1 DEAD/DEAH box helicase [Ideonella livida]
MATLALNDYLALGPAERFVALAVTLGGRLRTRPWIHTLLHGGLWRDPAARLTHEVVRQALQTLGQHGWLRQDTYRAGHWEPSPQALAVLYPALLESADIDRLRRALAEADHYSDTVGGRQAYNVRFPDEQAAFARVRLEALAASDPEQLRALEHRLPWGISSLGEVLDRAVTDVLDDDLLPMLHPDLQVGMVHHALLGLLGNWRQPPDLDLNHWIDELLALETGPSGANLRLLWAEAQLMRGDAPDLARLLAPALVPLADPDPGLAERQQRALALQAAQAVARGAWEEAIAGYESALPLLRKLSGQRRGLLGAWPGSLYPLALMARPEPEHLQRALKYCLAEGGKREPVPDSPYGLLAEALRMRLAEVPLNLRLFLPRSGLSYSPQHPAPSFSGDGPVMILDFWRWLARAWLKTGGEAEALSADERAAARLLRQHLEGAGFGTLSRWLDQALDLLDGRPVPDTFFVSPPRPAWELALDALSAVAQPEGAGAEADKPETRLVWCLTVEEDGSVSALQPLEQRLGARGWSKAKEVPLSRLQRTAEALPAADARLARCIRAEAFGRGLRLDLPAALSALVGHPQVALWHSPERNFELVEGQPELDVVREPDRLRVRLLPAIDLQHCQAVEKRWAGTPAEQKELEALRGLRVVLDSPQRGRLIQLSPAQRRVAQLLGPQGLVLPPAGAARLKEVLGGLGMHFQIQSDAAGVQAARELPADARLRAELSPVGDALSLRVVAVPYGQDYLEESPRLVPGAGRQRVVTALRGETLGVQRDLAAERAHLDTLLDACPMLVPPPAGAPAEWLVEEPEAALTLVERLPTLACLQGVDWPKGQPVRVEAAGLDQLALRVHTRQDWLGLDGELGLDEGLVLSLHQLLSLTAQRKSRFVPLGQGRYLALTQELRERLDDLSAVAETANAADLAQLRIPAVAAPWLQQLTEGTQLQVDPAFADRLARLDQARQVVPALPATLQAQLRPYQEEGYEWAMRLAHAGLGACLADDMGLGKTLQALAVLLARAGQGPALVVAPTSLVGNWRAEARRFAPSLEVIVHAEGGADRTEALAQLGRQQLVVVSYPMLQIDQAAFAAVDWATLVLDEAQAIKNAQAKRSQAVFELRAAFRLALSGTPIENRLAELWSIMRACNPGLLGSLARFNERFAGPIERQRDKTAQRQLRRLISPFILRRTKAQVLDDLPPRTELVLQVEGDATERAHYEALRRQVLADAERSLSGDAPGQAHLNILAGLTRLRRAACDPRLVSPQLALPGAKVQAFAELAAELVANGHKALVFSQFVDFLALLKAPLDAAGIAYQYLDGSTPGPERMKRVDAFQAGQGDLFLISLKAGGFGLNLTVADYVVIADPWWNPAAEDQASGRAHRMGQQRPVTVYRLVHQGTLEEKILTLHRDKRELADLLLEGGEARALPPADELLALMRGQALPPDETA